jgi:hypothetical protein
VSQNYYKLYIDSVIELASTIVIKSEYAAQSINNRLLQLYGLVADEFDKTTWKYYLNLSGAYHHTDEIIEITSLDNLEKITFDRQTLLNHPATLEAYKFGSRYYRELVTSYPDMQQFILGCLYPVDINKAIQSEDGSVLSYPSYLVEINEESLIPNIEKWCKNFKARWTNSQFNVSDNLYAATNLGVMYLSLVPLIINLRLKACKTREVHSFHIRQYLASHGFLDVYIDFLTLKQKLFLYRNIAYIERNSGRAEIFKWLIQHLMTERNLPIAEYSMRHNTDTLESTYYSDPNFRRRDLNSVYSPATKALPVIDLKELLRREEPLAVSNPEYIIENSDNIKRKFENSLSSVVMTKVLESSVIDYTDSEKISIMEIKLGHWLYNSANNLYSAVINFKDPITSEEKTLSAFDAYVYWFYCYCKINGIDLQNIPNFFAYKVAKDEPIDALELSALVNDSKVPLDTIQYLIDNKIQQTEKISVEAFSSFIENVYWTHKRQTIFLSSIQNFDIRGQYQAVVDSLYKNEIIESLEVLENKDGIIYSSYDHWLAQKGLVNNNYSIDTYRVLFLEIFRAATGGDLNSTKDLAALQKAMVRLLQQLSSYSIQILTDINTSSIRNLGNSYVRLGDIIAKENPIHDVLAINVYCESVETEENNDLFIPVMPVGIKQTSNSTAIASERIEIETKVRPDKSNVLKNYAIRLGTMIINHSFVNPTAAGPIKFLPPYNQFFGLTDEDKRSIKDVYHQVFYDDDGQGRLETNLLIFRNHLSGFNPLRIIKPILNSFNYKYLPYKLSNKIKVSINSTIEGMLPNLGSLELEAYKLFSGESVTDLFKLLGGINFNNSFILFNGVMSLETEYIESLLGFGRTLNAFTLGIDRRTINAFSYIYDEQTITGFSYISDNQTLDFIRDIISKTTVHHPYMSGSLFNGFSLVNQNGESTYNIVGFTYNGQQVIWG